MTSIKDRIASAENATICNTADFVAPAHAEAYALPKVVAALTSNDAKKVVNEVPPEISIVLDQVASTLSILADARMMEKHPREGLTDHDDDGRALSLMASIVALCSSATCAVDNAEFNLGEVQALKGGRHA